MSGLKISFIQTSLFWQDIGANLAMFEEKIWEINDKPDIIVLPEMFNTGFSMDAKLLAEPVNFTTYKWMHQVAQQSQAAIAGSYIVKENGHFYNRLYWVEPNGKTYQYDKRHLFRMGEEHQTYAPGQKKTIIQYKDWNILPLICYDLRFPVWSRNNLDQEKGTLEYDLLIYVANWPAPRTDVWNTLLKARALENQSYCMGVNRLGTDGMKVEYSGHSVCYDFKGQPLNDINSEPGTQTVELDRLALREFRNKFPAYLDGDRFKLDF